MCLDILDRWYDGEEYRIYPEVVCRGGRWWVCGGPSQARHDDTRGRSGGTGVCLCVMCVWQKVGMMYVRVWDG